MVSRKVVVSLLLVYLVSLLAEHSEGFMPFFTHSDFQKMQEKERNRGGQKKSLSSLQQLEEEGLSEQSSVGVNTAKTIQGQSSPTCLSLLPSTFLSDFSVCPQQAVPVRAGMWLTPRQLEKYQDVLEKLLAELLQDTPDG
ncbi:MOTI protein, partial [Serilophus lunatus]|nr:MOTI protein [Serilophus lunatus]